VPFQFLAPELPKWDALATSPGGAPELLVAPFFTDERPLRGAAGLCDWRMCGRLSRHLAAGRLTGELGETALLPARGLAFHKLLLVGLGPSEQFLEERFRSAARVIADVVHRLGVERWALPLPGRNTGRIAARRALDLWLAEVGDAAAPEEVWLVEPVPAQKDLSELLGRRLR
jgi:hypothetical protein